MWAFQVNVSNKYTCFHVRHIVLFHYLNFNSKSEIMVYSNPMESAIFRRVAAGELSAEEVCARAAENPEYLGNWEVCEAAQEMASGGESDDKTLTESMAAASISGSAEAVSTYASLPRPLLPRPTPAHLVLFQGGGPQALEMYHAPQNTPV